jgi:hypothetical protein
LLGGLFWAAFRAIDAWSSPWGDLAKEDGRSKALDQAWADTLRRMEEKPALARSLAGGRLTLLEAAARFRDLDRGASDFNVEEFRHTYPGASDDERHCREAIAWVREEVLPDAPQAEAIAQCLEAELQYHIDRGTLCLDRRPTPGHGRP